MNTRTIPAVIMLLAGSIACIVTYLNHYSFSEMLTTLFIVLIVFLIIGLIVKRIFDSIHLPGEDAVSADGEVIEKSEDDKEIIVADEPQEEGNPAESNT